VHNTFGQEQHLWRPATGVLVFSASVPVTVTISHNRIRNDYYAIWLGVAGHVTATMSDKVFQNVTTDVFTSP
jgi:hypothetical protein